MLLMSMHTGVKVSPVGWECETEAGPDVVGMAGGNNKVGAEKATSELEHGGGVWRLSCTPEDSTSENTYIQYMNVTSHTHTHTHARMCARARACMHTHTTHTHTHTEKQTEIENKIS